MARSPQKDAESVNLYSSTNAAKIVLRLKPRHFSSSGPALLFYALWSIVEPLNCRGVDLDIERKTTNGPRRSEI